MIRTHCADCGIDITDRATRSRLLYCLDCREKRDRVHRREYKARLRAGHQAVARQRKPPSPQESLVCTSCKRGFVSADLTPLCPGCAEAQSKPRVTRGRPADFRPPAPDPIPANAMRCMDCGAPVAMPAWFSAKVRCAACSEKTQEQENIDWGIVPGPKKPHWTLARKVARESFYR